LRAEMLRNLVLGIYAHIILFENRRAGWLRFMNPAPNAPQRRKASSGGSFGGSPRGPPD
jgi:hypothetical protein